MPHAVVTRNLGRERSFRKATVRSLAQALLKYERINTTLPRAKEARRLAERLITLGKAGSLASRRHALRLLNDPSLVGRLFSEVAPRFSSRQGGYTRIFRTGYRPGDGARMAILELTELAPQAPKGKPFAKTKMQETPKAQEKPKVQERSKVQEKPRVPEKPQEKVSEEKEKKPEGFLQGLRKFFKGKPKK